MVWDLDAQLGVFVCVCARARRRRWCSFGVCVICVRGAFEVRSTYVRLRCAALRCSRCAAALLRAVHAALRCIHCAVLHSVRCAASVALCVALCCTALHYIAPRRATQRALRCDMSAALRHCVLRCAYCVRCAVCAALCALRCAQLRCLQPLCVQLHALCTTLRCTLVRANGWRSSCGDFITVALPTTSLDIRLKGLVYRQ